MTQIQDELNQLVALLNSGHYAELENRANILVGKHPEFGSGWKLLSVSLFMQGKNPLLALQKSSQLLPEDAGIHNNLGIALLNLGQSGSAASSFRRATEIKPDYAEAHINLANTLRALGHFDSAVVSYLRALQLKPDDVDAHNDMGIALEALGQFDAAIASYHRALKIKPDYAEVYCNLGNVLNNLGKSAAAVASYQRALELKPNFAVAHYNLGNVLKELMQFDAALASYRRVLEIKPDSAEALNNLGLILKDLGQLDDALACFRRALEFNPDFVTAQINLLVILNYTAHPSKYCLEEAQKYGRMVSKKVTSRFTAWQCADQPQRLRVGMVSGNLRNHPAGYFLEGLLVHINPAQVELICYVTHHNEDELTARIRNHFSAWKSLVGKSDEDAARLIHADGVHVLLDLSGHSEHNRLPIFAWKPAPVQASWLDYYATTGVAEMDYYLADEVGVPEVHRGHFTETVWYLPDTRLCFTLPEIDLPISPLPAIKNGYLTFGCFQTLAKVSDEVLAAWINILISLPSSRLRWQCKQLSDPAVVKQQVQRLQKHGIDPARVELHGFETRKAYQASHAAVDMILDTFPYPGGTTTCEALWMGVPTLTFAGDTLLARQGASLLTAAGLGDWVTNNVADYIAKAVEIAGDLPKLAALRAGLREQVSTSPLFDAKRFARNLEVALWGMWQARTHNNIPIPPELQTKSHD